MCGILFYFSPSDIEDSQTSLKYEELIPLIRSRGPDVQTHSSPYEHVKMYSSVLSLRPPLTQQPLEGVLQFNGELYNDDLEGNDTVYFLNLIRSNGVKKAVQLAQGEFAFTYQDGPLVWFGRDCIGRRSLMYELSDNKELLIASVGLEEEALGGCLYCFHMETKSLDKFEWSYDEKAELRYPYPRVNTIPFIPTELQKHSYHLRQLLSTAVRKRFHTKLSILFSGGLDCTVLAYLAAENSSSTEKITLLNVAFENPRTKEGYQTPDRLVGIRSFEELEKLHPNRFDFHEVNVPYSETLAHRDHVRKLMSPQDSVMDLSIAIAFYFASQPVSALTSDSGKVGPVLFSGLGADELFGGYTRHARTFAQGPDTFASELQLDFSRLHSRNLGRDDRVVAGWGRESRYPYLDETVVDWAQRTCPIGLKENKMVLRQVARDLGFFGAAEEKKRAIQFGARSAKMELGSGKIKGHEKLV